jgi:hypothetical protein
MTTTSAPVTNCGPAVKTVIVADLVANGQRVSRAGAAQGAGQQHQLPLVIFSACW